MKKFFISTTIPASLNFFKGNLEYLSSWFDICAISSNAEMLKEIGKREGVRTHCIPMERPISLLKDFISLLKFVYFFLIERPYVVHGNTPKAAMLTMVAGWITRIPVRIYMCHGLRYQGTQGRMRKLLILMEKLSCTCATRVICVSNGVRDTFEKDGICSLSKSIVIGSGSATGIDLEYFNPKLVDTNLMRKELGISQNDFVFIFVGRIVTDKGINELVSAFNKLTNKYNHIHLVLVGGEETEQNPIYEVTREIIRKNNRIYAIGRRNDVRPYLAGANAFVFPSYREGFGMVVIEANAMGIPAICSDIIGCNEIIVSGTNGEIVPPKDEQSLYLKMEEWIVNPKNIGFMSDNTRVLVKQRYDRKVVWKNTLDEYLRLAK